MARSGSPIDCIDDGDTTWMLLSTLLVLTMCPALALFESGLLRSKSTMSVVSQVGCTSW
jgi:Amt family ammonium transporter